MKDVTLNKVSFTVSTELGFIDTFFSSTNPEFGKLSQLKVISKPNGSISHVTSANGKVSIEETFIPNGREIKIRILNETLLMDAVQRFVFKKNDVSKVYVGNRLFLHKNENYYHQLPADIVRFEFNNGTSISFLPYFHCVEQKFSPLVYVRDEKGMWIFHIRLLATKPDSLTFKGCHRLYNKPFPKIIQSIAHFLKINKATLYIREKLSQRIPFQTNGAVKVQSNTNLAIGVKWIIH